MTDLTVFKNEEFGEIRTVEQENKGKHTGFFYVLEWDNVVKIGSTKEPYTRVMALKRNAENYGGSKLGRLAISVPHTNYAENEKKLHIHFSSKRKSGSELFEIEFETAISEIPEHMEYIDDSEKIDQRGDIFLAGMKDLLLGNHAAGDYTAGQEQMNESKPMAEAILVAQRRIEELDKIIEELKPKALFADAVVKSRTSILIGELAKILKQNGIDIGHKRLFAWMRDNGYLMKDGSERNMPTQRAMELGLFEIKESTVNNPDGSVRINRTTKVTGKGQQYFINKFLQ